MQLVQVIQVEGVSATGQPSCLSKKEKGADRATAAKEVSNLHGQVRCGSENASVYGELGV
jgi:hypothetical protein